MYEFILGVSFWLFIFASVFLILSGIMKIARFSTPLSRKEGFNRDIKKLIKKEKRGY